MVDSVVGWFLMFGYYAYNCCRFGFYCLFLMILVCLRCFWFDALFDFVVTVWLLIYVNDFLVIAVIAGLNWVGGNFVGWY